jgi:hypothetical protein
LTRRTQPRTTRPLRFTPTAPGRSFPATTGRSASASRDGTQSLTGSARLGHSLSPSPPGRQYRDAPSHVPCESPDQAHVAYMPDTAWPISGHPPDSSRAKSKHPVLMSPLRYDTSPATPPARGCAPSSWSSPDASYDAFSTSLTTTVFSQRSRWRFEASPRRAAPKGQLLHLSHSIASRNLAYIDGSSLRSWHTEFRSCGSA